MEPCGTPIRMVRAIQRIYISDRTHSTPQRLPDMCLTQPLPALSNSQVVGVVYSMYTTDRAGRGWVKHMLGRCSGMLCVLSLIYILWNHHFYVHDTVTLDKICLVVFLPSYKKCTIAFY